MFLRLTQGSTFCPENDQSSLPESYLIYHRDLQNIKINTNMVALPANQSEVEKHPDSMVQSQCFSLKVLQVLYLMNKGPDWLMVSPRFTDRDKIYHV